VAFSGEVHLQSQSSALNHRPLCAINLPPNTGNRVRVQLTPEPQCTGEQNCGIDAHFLLRLDAHNLAGVARRDRFARIAKTVLLSLRRNVSASTISHVPTPIAHAPYPAEALEKGPRSRWACDDLQLSRGWNVIQIVPIPRKTGDI
jgi:hypothetical protein